jgi:hypothetical protein
MVCTLTHLDLQTLILILIRAQLVRIRSRDGNFRFELRPTSDISELVTKVSYAHALLHLRIQQELIRLLLDIGNNRKRGSSNPCNIQSAKRE